ncbi:signal peptide, CUB and EGF-like domain-containing protein 2 [Myxocyprinus asiaticus]|uniref:signal peptide, CUB and EGF-like domain-containing protein 2 n=1 Tax=Myxocyprinus asiaticus TaxID=70543 RepID=UPI0022215F46|nr:signal peptide, CUB and EGF-like domain-containing protein 2 [Myxocyprinus asiaticus]
MSFRELWKPVWIGSLLNALYCMGSGNVSATGPCSDGFLCFGGAFLSSPNDNETGIPCLSGSYSIVGSFAAIPCPNGTFRYVVSRSSTTPPPSGGASSPLPQWTAVSPATPGGWNRSSPSRQTAVVRPALGGRQQPLHPQADGHGCSPGRWQRRGLRDSASLTGFGTTVIGKGWEMRSQSARPVDGLQGYICPSGHSCPIGASVEVPCEPCTYNSATGAAHCLSCPAGTMCPSPGTQKPLPCPLGNSQQLCPALLAHWGMLPKLNLMLHVCPVLPASNAVHLACHNHRV